MINQLRLMSKKTKFYISGRMAGHRDHNIPAFMAAEEELRSLGFFDIFNPGRNSLQLGLNHPRETYLRHDFAAIANDCNAIYLLDGWESSHGACAELVMAHALDLPIFSQSTKMRMPLSAFQEYGSAKVKILEDPLTRGK